MIYQGESYPLYAERLERQLQSAQSTAKSERERAHALETQLSDAHRAIDAAANRQVRITVPFYGEYPVADMAHIAERLGQSAGRAMIDHATDVGALARRAAILEYELLNRCGPELFPLRADDGGLALEATKGGNLHAELIRTQLELRKVKDEFAAFRLRDLHRPVRAP